MRLVLTRLPETRLPGAFASGIVATVLATLVGLAIPSVAAAQSDSQSELAVDFNRDIRPIFTKHCFNCHGPDKAEGGLRLNREDAARAELDSGEHGIVPGRVEQSEVVRRIASTDESERMPPEGKPLTPTQIELIRRWIAEGAKFEQHWAYQPLVRPAVPTVKDNAWVRSPIDAFILKKLEVNKLTPAAPADKVALLRRATFDLIGLPPTWEETQAFLADNSPQAYEKVLDRLLASEHHGEQWGRHWLDVVRYAETNSFERDNPKPHVWRYRDYVIRALNEDKPYDQFIREQIAGDELVPLTNDGLIATGFYRLGLWDDEPADREQARFDELDDLVTTTSQGFLGLTVNCARCHDHKIDPISQKDYYSLLAFFANIRPMSTRGPNIERPLLLNPADSQKHDAAVAQLEAERNAAREAINAIEAQFVAAIPKEAGDESIAPADLDDLTFRYYRDTWDTLPDFSAIKPETTGKVPSGLFDLSLTTREAAFGFVFEGFLKVPTDGEYQFFLDSDDGSRLTIDGKPLLTYDGIHGVGSEQRGTVRLAKGRVPVKLEYFQRHGGWGLHVAWAGPGLLKRYLSTNVGSADGLRKGRSGKNGAASIPQMIQADAGQTLGQPTFQRYTALRKQLEQLNKREIPVELALAITEDGRSAPETFLMERGNPHSPGEKVEPAFVQVLDSRPIAPAQIVPTEASSGRRKVLADWLASKENTLTARVMANRIWQHHFGRGIVRSPNNFGGLGIPPTHPQLLDWLACEFMDGGWKLKRLHKQIMLSNTYRMSSHASPEALAVDPANDLFARFDMRRLAAEEVRDTILATSGKLNEAMYGPSVYPEISAEVLAGQSRPGSGWPTSSPRDAARRSVYVHVKRSLALPLLSVFDFPDSDFSCEARFSTTQPAQALSMMNGKFLGDEAAAFAARIAREAGDDPAARIRRAFEIALCRHPSAEELERGIALVAMLQKEHRQQPELAWKYYCLTILNRNEFLYLD